MPRHPALAATLDSMRSDLFSSLAHRLANLSGDTFPLHIGDTYLEPAAGARMEDLTVAENPGMHRYTRPHGHPELIQRLSKQRGVPSDRILATAGATGGLCALADTTLDPGDEVLVLAPFWPLIRGIVQAAGGIPRQVPFYDRPGDVPDRLETHLTDRTVALYVNSPNNPTGRTLSEAEVAALAAFARSHDLWIWSDEVYEQFAYTGPHRPIAPAAPERTFTAFSFSKAWGMAGNRVGYLVGPTDPSALAQVRKIGTHTWYSASTAAQLAAARVLDIGGGWLADARLAYRAAGVAAADRLGCAPPDGGTFLFIDVADHLDERGLLGFLERCIDHGLLLAPGSSFGTAYGTHVRLCFTSAPPDVVARGVEVLANILDR